MMINDYKIEAWETEWDADTFWCAWAIDPESKSGEPIWGTGAIAHATEQEARNVTLAALDRYVTTGSCYVSE